MGAGGRWAAASRYRSPAAPGCRAAPAGGGSDCLACNQKDARGVPANTVAVARIRRDLFGRSDAGVIVVSREGARPGDFNRAYGADRNLRAGANWTANVFWAATTGPDLRGGNDQKRLSSRWDNGFAVDGGNQPRTARGTNRSAPCSAPCRRR